MLAALLLRRLTHGFSQHVTPAWSPDGTQIAYVSENADTSGIFLMNADGGDARQLTSGGFLPAWSPDGQYIAYLDVVDKQPEIFCVALRDGGIRRLTWHAVEKYTPTWRPG